MEAKGNAVSLKEGSVKVKCDRCTCDILDPGKVDGDDLHFCKRCEDCIDNQL
jgi:hypothetical protein